MASSQNSQSSFKIKAGLAQMLKGQWKRKKRSQFILFINCNYMNDVYVMSKIKIMYCL